jgi:hypothetical protein
MKQKLIYVLIVAFLISVLPSSILAVTQYEDADPSYNEDFIISDAHFTDNHSMTVEQIQAFLELRGVLGSYVDPLTHMTAAFIIYNEAKTYGISPKVLLTLLQKEQSLIEDPSPSQSQYDWATGYSCYAGTCDDEWQGFSRQVKGAARRFMIGYWEDLASTGCTFTNWCINQTKRTQDGVLITPKSLATAALYTYNPYRGNTVMNGMKIGANYNFWKIWNRWFSQTYPDGSLVKATNENKVYLIRDGQKRWITSYATLATRYNPDYIIEIDPSELDSYEEGPAIKFPLYALVKTPNGAIYLIADEEKRMIVSWEVFRTIGFNPEEVEDISFKDLAGIPSGKALTLYDAYPVGGVLKSQTTDKIYYVESGMKYLIVSEELADIRFSQMTITDADETELEQYELGNPIKLKDGILVKDPDSSQVYVIANGQRRSIPTEQVFNSFGFKWTNVKTITKELLELHELGDPLDVKE